MTTAAAARVRNAKGKGRRFQQWVVWYPSNLLLLLLLLLLRPPHTEFIYVAFNSNIHIFLGKGVAACSAGATLR